MKQTSAVSVQPTEKRRSQAPPLSRKNSDDSTTKTKQQRKRLSFWESSNPDNSADESIPPVPALVRSGATTPESRRSREHRRKDSGLGDSAQVCEKIAPRRTYTPRNAAAGFLMSTSGASEATCKNFRKSFQITDYDEVVCLTEEQRCEWEKLRSVQKNFAQGLDRYNDSELDSRPKYSNKQALAALEFGMR